MPGFDGGRPFRSIVSGGDDLPSHRRTVERGGFRADVRFDRNVGHADPAVRQAQNGVAQDDTLTIEALAALLDSEDHQSEATIEALGNTRSARAVVPLLRTLDHCSPGIVTAAIRALVRIGPTAARPLCAYAMSTEDNWRSLLLGEGLAEFGLRIIPLLPHYLKPACCVRSLHFHRWWVVCGYVRTCPCPELRELLPLVTDAIADLGARRPRLVGNDPESQLLVYVQWLVEQAVTYRKRLPIPAEAPGADGVWLPRASQPACLETEPLPLPFGGRTDGR